MAAKKKTKKKHAKVKKTTVKKGTTVRKRAKRTPATKKPAPAKRLEKKPAKKKSAATKTPAKKVPGTKTAVALKKRSAARSQNLDPEAFALQGLRPQPASQSGDLQGLSNVEGADSESVDELLEEGNALEADAVAGVEAAGNADEQEVRTHEVPQDDVPGEYQDED